MLLDNFIKKKCCCTDEFFNEWVNDVEEELIEKILLNTYEDNLINRSILLKGYCNMAGEIQEEKLKAIIIKNKMFIVNEDNNETEKADDDFFNSYYELIKETYSII